MLQRNPMKNAFLSILLIVFSITASELRPKQAFSILDVISEEINILKTSKVRKDVEKGFSYQNLKEFDKAVKSFERAKKKVSRGDEQGLLTILDILLIDNYRKDNLNYYTKYSFDNNLYKHHHSNLGYAYRLMNKDTTLPLDDLTGWVQVSLALMKLDLVMYQYSGYPFGSTEDAIAKGILRLQSSADGIGRILDRLYPLVNTNLYKKSPHDECLLNLLFEYDYTIVSLYDEIGMLYATAPIPQDLDKDEQDIYRSELEKYANENYCKGIEHCEKLINRIDTYEEIDSPIYDKTEEKIQTLFDKVDSCKCDDPPTL